MKLLVLVCLIGASCASLVQPYMDDGLQDLGFREGWTDMMRSIARADAEDAHLNFEQLVTKYGYPVEEYVLTTRDGYILSMQRIPHGREPGRVKYRGVAFLQHGLLCSSYDWIIPGPEKGLAYLLADRGYDVWMGNFRGNSHSKNHTKLDISDEEFWNFSWHEMGVEDLPTMIDFVLEKTGEKQVHHIGHSQGTTTFYVMASERPEYNDKIRAHYSLAPIAYMDHMTSPLMQLLAKAEGGLAVILKLIGMHEFVPTNGFIHEITQTFCRGFEFICANTLYMVCGFNPGQFNSTLFPIMMGHTPAGSSTKQILHYAQLVNSAGILSKGKFRQYDYGFFGNRKKYGQSNPPIYNLKKITAPTYLYYSHNDWLSAETDVNRLYKELGNARGKFLNPDSKFNHIDYMFGIDAVTLVYDKVFSTMLRH